MTQLDRAVSIHAPGEGSDVGTASAPKQEGMFQSTLPARGATAYG